MNRYSGIDSDKNLADELEKKEQARRLSVLAEAAEEDALTRASGLALAKELLSVAQVCYLMLF